MHHKTMPAMIFALASAVAFAETPEIRPIEEITIIGTTDKARELPGTGSVLDAEQLDIQAARDINQLLKTVPGVYILEEDGYGLRPNIGIRGATAERSSKITLLEDGVLMAPAPYSNPEAYYFPTVSRMHSIEVLKGAPLLRYGPQTTGGIVNLVSTPIPAAIGGQLNAAYGQNAEADLLASFGGRTGAFGFLVETAQRRGDGFKDIDRSNRNSGYDISDYMLKLAWETERQSILFKAQHSAETSDETYLGLTDADFDRDADRRYGLSAPDEMDNDHAGYSLVYQLALTDQADITLTGYYNEFSRNWFKLDGGGDFINAANTGDTFAQGVLEGSSDVTNLQYRNNNRDYISKGVELNLDIDAGAHQLAVGGRVHSDEMDRFQPVDIADQINGTLVFTDRIEPTGSDNRLEEADALALWAIDAWQLSNALNLNLALRYEDVKSSRRQYADPERIALDSTRSNDSSVWLPGVSLTYDINSTWQALAGVHRGFSPLGGGATEQENPETSINYEAGLRYQGTWFLEAVSFYSDFTNKTENCSNADPCSNGATSGSFNTGEATISGIELQAGTELGLGSFSVPVKLMYTYTDAKVSNDSWVTGFERGDELASVPANTFSAQVGLLSPIGWDNYVVAKYIGEMCVSIGCNNTASQFDRTQNLFVIDYISRYDVAASATMFLKVENLLNERAIVSRQPDGARPNKPRTLIAGLTWSF